MVTKFLLALCVCAACAHAAEYPNKSVQVIVFLNGAALAQAARADYRDKGELIKALNIKSE